MVEPPWKLNWSVCSTAPDGVETANVPVITSVHRMYSIRSSRRISNWS
jgi:hypothetical protein